MQMSLALPCMPLHFSFAALASCSMRCFSALVASFDPSAAKSGPAHAKLNAAAAIAILVNDMFVSLGRGKRLRGTMPRRHTGPRATAVPAEYLPLRVVGNSAGAKGRDAHAQ